MNLRKIGKWSNYWLVSIKDALGNTAMYAYRLNLGKQTAVEYRYDAWGNEIGAAATGVGALNPFRYRGYVYDDETKLYYLESRYYKPEWGKFISADAVLGKTGAVFSHNLFAYCRNNPVMMVDPNGYSRVSLETAMDSVGYLRATNQEWRIERPKEELRAYDILNYHLLKQEGWRINAQRLKVVINGSIRRSRSLSKKIHRYRDSPLALVDFL